MNNPSITIILPAYNGAQWIEKAIRSALAQTYRDFEFLIINDSSKDDTEAVVLRLAAEDPRINYFKNEKNMGVQATRNFALEHVRSEYIAEIDQDDEWIDPDKLKKQIEFLESHADYVLVGTGAIMIDESGKEIARYLMPETNDEIRRKILRMNCFIHSSVMYRTRAVKEIGGYSLAKLSEDHDLWLRLGRKGKFANFQEYSVQYLFTPKGFNSQNKLFRLKQNIQFAHEHKDFYPNYLPALALGWAKLFFYPIFNLMPSSLKGMFLKLHKKL
jgi:glycosyltransferase involved in cell wall biosynthesis